MGKNLIQQRRGRGTSTFRARSFTARDDVRIPTGKTSALVEDLVTSTHHSAPLLKVRYDDGSHGFLLAAEGVMVGQTILFDGPAETGNILKLKDVPDGTTVHNLELAPGDGGKLVRGSGGAARVLTRQDGKVTILLPSKKKRLFNENCRVCLGTVAGGGRLEKPIMRAGTMFHKMRAKNKYWPKVTGAAMNAVSHPFGGKRTSRKGRPTIAPRNAPPGRMVGMIRPRKTGRARGTRVRKN